MGERSLSVLAVVGPTAAGKSELAVALAVELGAEILSVDSMQVYRGMDIGTAKPGAATRANVRHHLIDLVDPHETYTAADHQRHGRSVLADLQAADVPAIIAGGTGLHFRALIDPLDFPPTDAELRRELEQRTSDELRAELVAADASASDHVDLANPRRVLRAVEVMRLTGATPTSRASDRRAAAVRGYAGDIDCVTIGVDPGDTLAARIEARFDAMLAAGFVDEVAGLAPRLGRTARQAVGYRELLDVVTGLVTLEEGRIAVIRATKRLAKRQRTFFGRDPRVRWIPWHDSAEARVAAARRVLEEAGVWTS